MTAQRPAIRHYDHCDHLLHSLERTLRSLIHVPVMDFQTVRVLPTEIDKSRNYLRAPYAVVATLRR